jgi:hypothetical protein
MTLVYCDTSAILDWLESSASKPTSKAAICGPRLVRILRSEGVTAGIGELTIIETLNAVHTAWRDTDRKKAAYDGDWARESQASLLEAVAARTFQVLKYGPADMEHALMLVTQMTEWHRRDFRAWDAVHLRLAVQWSRETDEPVQLVTSNGDFEAFLDLHPAFRRHIDLVDLRK